MFYDHNEKVWKMLSQRTLQLNNKQKKDKQILRKCTTLEDKIIITYDTPERGFSSILDK